MGEEILRLENIVKEFPGVKALDGVSLQLCAGECHALIGENGAGKSTLMKIVSGLYKPTSGKIFYNGEEITIKNGIPEEEMLTVEKRWGYFSHKDGELHRFDICEECYDTWIASFQIPVYGEQELEC